MPRQSDAEKQRSHKRILDAAAEMFRARGIESASVADVMKAAGMTHGGFYRHFASKDDLVASAFGHAVDEIVSDIERAATDRARNDAREAYIAKYLSTAHLEDSGKGCPLAALGTELARQDGASKEAGSAAFERMAGLLQKEGYAAPDQGMAAMALLLGSVTLARLASSPDDAERMLEAGRTGVRLMQDHWPGASG